MIHHREIYQTENLTPEDFIHGIGFDTSLYCRILEKRNQLRTKDDYYHADGQSIDGTIRVKRFHPLLNKILVDIRDNQRVIIESVHKHWYIGEYWCLVYRTIGTKSHGTLNFKNLSSINSITIESILETQENWKFEDGSEWE